MYQRRKKDRGKGTEGKRGRIREGKRGREASILTGTGTWNSVSRQVQKQQQVGLEWFNYIS